MEQSKGIILSISTSAEMPVSAIAVVATDVKYIQYAPTEISAVSQSYQKQTITMFL